MPLSPLRYRRFFVAGCSVEEIRCFLFRVIIQSPTVQRVSCVVFSSLAVQLAVGRRREEGHAVRPLFHRG